MGTDSERQGDHLRLAWRLNLILRFLESPATIRTEKQMATETAETYCEAITDVDRRETLRHLRDMYRGAESEGLTDRRRSIERCMFVLTEPLGDHGALFDTDDGHEEWNMPCWCHSCRAC